MFSLGATIPEATQKPSFREEPPKAEPKPKQVCGITSLLAKSACVNKQYGFVDDFLFWPQLDIKRNGRTLKHYFALYKIDIHRDVIVSIF